MKKYPILLVLILLIAACEEKEFTGYILAGDNKLLTPSKQEILLSQLISDHYELVYLESNPESIIGKIGKIVKKDGNYYILSNDRWILKFDANGKYLGQLSKMGGAPEEYTNIGDFNIYGIDGKAEIWICDYTSLKIYNAETFDYIKSLPIGKVINKFYRLEDGDLLLMTGQEESSLALAGPKGNIKTEYLKKEIPFLTLKPVQFNRYGTKVIFPLGYSDEFVWFDVDKKEFDRGKYSKKDNFLLSDQLIELFKKHHEDYFLRLNEYNYVRNLRNIRDKSYLDIYFKGQRYLASMEQLGNIQNGYFWGTTNIKNDLFPLDDLSFLSTLGYGETDDNSILFVIEDDELIRKLNQERGIEPESVWGDENPYLVLFY